MGYKSTKEWFDQADYDIETAEAMFLSGRYIYALFMAHLSIEKALKGLWAERFKEDAPKTHNLEFLREKLELILPEKNLQENLLLLNRIAIPVRYPDDLKKLSVDFPQDVTLSILNNSKNLLQWLKKIL